MRRKTLLAPLAALWLALPAQAWAGFSDEVAQLRASPCPPYQSAAQGKHSPDEVAAALRGHFEILDLGVRIIPPLHWTKDPYESGQWRSDLQRFAWIDPLLYDYQQHGRLAALRHARRLVLDWVRANRDPRRGVSPEGWRDKVVGDRVAYMAYVTRAAACEGMLGPRSSGILLHSLKRQGHFLARNGNVPSNRGLFANLGLGLLANYLPFDPEAPKWLRLARSRFPRILSGRLQPDEGVWLEQSTGYQFAAAKAVDKFIHYLAPNDNVLLADRAAMRKPDAWFVEPDGAATQIGDTNLKPAPAWAVQAAADNQGLKFMPQSGYAVIKQAGSYLAVAASFFHHTHKHSDELSFQLYEGGHRVVTDGGKYDGDRNPYRAFANSNNAASTLAVDGLDFRRGSKLAYGSGLQDAGQGDGWYAIIGTNPLVSQQGVSHGRLFLYKPGEALVIVDTLTATVPHTYQRYFQLGPDLDIQQGADDLVLSAAGFHGSLYDAPSVAGQATRAAVKGSENPVQGFLFPRWRQKIPRWTVQYESQGTSLTHVATVGLDSRELRATLESGPGTEVLIARPSGTPVYRVTVSGSQPLSVSATTY